MQYLLAFTAIALSCALATPLHIEDMAHGFIIPCEGDLCLDTQFCWKGARYADLNQIMKRVTVVVNFTNTEDTCVESESDDVLSLRALGFGNDDASSRLQNRPRYEQRWVSSLVLRTILGEHRVAGEGECNGNQCTLQMSPYGQSCIRLCSKAQPLSKMSANVLFASENSIDMRTIYMWLIGFSLITAAPKLSQNRGMFYLTGGSLGVMFAVALLVLIVARMTTRSGPTKSQLGLAAFFQVGVVYMRKALYDFIKSYIDWIALYVTVTFAASLALVHYLLTDQDGNVRPRESLKDIVRTALQLLGAFFIAAPIPSARYRIITIAVVFGTEVFFSLGLFSQRVRSTSKPIPLGYRSSESGRFRDRTPERSLRYSEDVVNDVPVEEVFYDPRSSTQTPIRQPSQASKKYSASRYLTEAEYKAQGRDYTDRKMKELLTPTKSATPKEQDILEWMRLNHSKLYVRKDEDEDEEEEEEDEDESIEDEEEDVVEEDED